MSFLTVSNGRLQTDSSSQLGELEISGLFSGKKFKKWKKVHMTIHKTLTPHGHIMLIKGLLDKKKKGKKKKKHGGGDRVTEESAVDTGAPSETVVPAGLQPPNSTPFDTTSGPMSPATSPMAPFYPSPMQPPIEYPSSQFPQAYPGGGGGGEQPYYAPQQQDSMPQYINTEEESRWQPPTPMYEGPSAYEADPGQRGTQVQQSQSNPFDTSENEYASGPDAGDNFPGASEMSGYLVSGGSGRSWEDQGWGGMAGEYDVQVQTLMAQAGVLRSQGFESQAMAMESQARQLRAMEVADAGAAQTSSNILLWGGIAVAAWLFFGGGGGSGRTRVRAR